MRARAFVGAVSVALVVGALVTTAAPASRATATVRIAGEPRAGVMAAGHLWVLADRGDARVLLELGAESGRPTGREVAIGSGVPEDGTGYGQEVVRPSLTVAGGALWTVDRTSGEVLRIDPRVAAVTARAPIGARYVAELRYGPGVLSHADRRLTRIGLPARRPATAAVTARVAPGWPRSVPAGTVHQGPGGGVVVVSRDNSRTGGMAHIVSAFRADGRRMWVSRRIPGCGNCDEGPQPEALQPDGTYGPIGAEGDDFWAVDARGRELAGCSGVVAPDGACTFVRPTLTPGTPGHPSVVARAPAGPLWSVDDPSYRWYPESDVPPMVVRDAAGLIYAGLGWGTDATTGAAQRGRLIAVDPATRSILWGRAGPYEALTSLRSGVLAVRDEGLVAFGPTGAELWSRPIPAGQGVAPSQTVYDGPRGRVYVGRRGDGVAGVTALEAGGGAQVWRTRPRDLARLLSVGRGGRVYLAIDAPGRRAVRAVRLADGSTVWQRRTRLPVLGARDLADGRVAVSAGNLYAPTRADRLTVLDPG